MRCNFLTQINEVIIHDYSIIEDEGIGNLVAGAEQMGWPGVKMEYEPSEDYGDAPGNHVIIISAPSQEAILKFLDFAELPVKILT